MTAKPVRKVAKQFVDSFRREFNDAVENARKPRTIAKLQFEKSADAEKDKHWFKQSRDLCGTIDVEIAECTLVVVNTRQRILLRLDNATQHFISSVVVPVLKEVVKETAGVPTSEVECSPDTKSHPSAFQLDANCMPNLRDKVTGMLPSTLGKFR